MVEMKIKLLCLIILSFSIGACKKDSTTNTEKQIALQKQNLYEQIEKAIKANDDDAFDLLIKDIPNLDSLIQEHGTDNSYSLLGYACKYNRCNIAEKIINLNANIEIGHGDEYFEYDALSIAVENEDLCLVKLLLNKGANPNRWYSEEGLTALSVSCRLNNFTISRILIENGANVNGEGDTGTDYIIYPLLFAVGNNNLELVRLLIDNGCKIDITNKQDETPFTVAERINNDEMSDLLLENLLLQRTF